MYASPSSTKSASSTFSVASLVIGFIITAISNEITFLVAVASSQLVVLWRMRVTHDELEEASFFLLAWTFLKIAAPTYQVWPFTFLLPLLITAGYSYFRRGRLTARLPLGIVSRGTIILGLAVAGVSITALQIWLSVFNPDLRIQQSFVPGGGYIILGAMLLGFALLNSAMEEIIYRGWWLYNSDDTNRLIVLVFCQAASFGAAHMVGGVPNGPVGYALTFVYALMLGILRIKSKGLLVPLIVHIITDMYIGVVLFTRN